jgi:transposase
MIESKRRKGEIQMANRSYTAEYRHNAVKLAEEIGASAAARELKISNDTLYTWISRAKSGDLPQSSSSANAKGPKGMAQRVKELERENKMLQSEISQIKRENQILEDAAAFFAARRKK